MIKDNDKKKEPVWHNMDTPKLTTKQVLYYMVDDAKGHWIDKEDVKDSFKIEEHDARIRLERLHSWGCVMRKRKDKDNNRGGFLYRATDWGFKCSEYWQKQEQGATNNNVSMTKEELNGIVDIIEAHLNIDADKHIVPIINEFTRELKKHNFMIMRKD